MAVSAANVAATTFGCLLESAGRRSSITGAGVSNSMYNRMASRADCLVAALVEDSPFSTKGVNVWPRVLEFRVRIYLFRNPRTTHLVHPSRPPNLRKAHNAAIPSCCAATFESATAPFHRLGSCRNGRKAGSCSSGVISNCFAASSYAAFLTFHI